MCQCDKANRFPDDYEADLESPWANPSQFFLNESACRSDSSSTDLFASDNDFSWENIAKGRNLYYQQQSAQQITQQLTQITSLLTSALNIHLNVGQNTTMNTSSIIISFQRMSLDALSNRTLQHIRLPSTLQSNLSEGTASPVSVRVDLSLSLSLTPSVTLMSFSPPFSLVDHSTIGIG